MKKLNKKPMPKLVVAFKGCKCQIRCQIKKGQGGGSLGDAAMNSAQSNITRHN
jgi:hypothetical protein